MRSNALIFDASYHRAVANGVVVSFRRQSTNPETEETTVGTPHEITRANVAVFILIFVMIFCQFSLMLSSPAALLLGVLSIVSGVLIQAIRRN